ncbi:hypothetical protein DFP72DRAFT_854220 [Ephemerocybe angulata]|uniref:Uncharacterized protein n=1 Tax=Ephemerocybe angulata TaxID=980116 RepID=A0A8H6LXI0_9AGAR|nr:hypothetical protein DFP72DRAFT_854220 [Tulosesus angulatus]
MPAPSLPQEIFDKITDQYAFGLDSLRPIKTLSLASRRHFLQRCRFHVFGSLTIVTDVSPRTMAMLESSPSLLTHVRKLSLVFDISNYQGPTRMDRAQRISQVIDKITGLVTLSIRQKSDHTAFRRRFPALGWIKLFICL